jgi:hypothetical protein
LDFDTSEKPHTLLDIAGRASKNAPQATGTSPREVVNALSITHRSTNALELSQLQIAVLIIALVGGVITSLGILVGFVVWLIRLEGRVNRNQERWADEKDSREKLSEHTTRHIENTDIHFNKQFFFEFKDKIESRLDEMADNMKAGFESVSEQIKEVWESK